MLERTVEAIAPNMKQAREGPRAAGGDGQLVGTLGVYEYLRQLRGCATRTDVINAADADDDAGVDGSIRIRTTSREHYVRP